MKLTFRDEGHLYVNCLFYILIIYRKCLLFQLLGCGIRPKGRISGCKTGDTLLGNVLLKFNSQNGGYLCAKCLFYILTVFREYLFFSSLVVAYIYTIASQQGFKKDVLATEKMVIFSNKMYFWSLISKIKVTCLRIACFLFRLFILKVFFFSS